MMTAMPYTVEHQNPGDIAAIEALLDRVFGADRQAKTSYQYRRGIAEVPGLSFVARQTGGGDRLLGTIRFWPVIIGTAPHFVPHASARALLLGPLAVAPERKNTGIGGRLIERGHGAARAQGCGVVVLVGDQDYYGRFGFSPASNSGIFMAGEPDRLMVREILPGALAGVAGQVQHRRGVRPSLRAA